MFSQSDNSLKGAEKLDHLDKLSHFREEFSIPKMDNGEEKLYFAGHSLGLMPWKAKENVKEVFDSWAKYGVDGHFEGEYPWLPYHEFLTEKMAEVVGAKSSEVVVMNTLTTNLHMMMVSFYRPTKKRYKILIENNAFPSDQYAVDSQARFHGFDPKEAILELGSDSREPEVIDVDDIIRKIEDIGEELSIVMLGNVNYLSGQSFPMKKIVNAAHKVGAFVGFNLAHGAGNLVLELHNDGADFAVWCSYKYLNSGPGGLAAAFVHERHHGLKEMPRFEGWWGHDKESRFQMERNFSPINSAEAWQLSNPPIFQLATIRASLDLFSLAGMKNIREKGDNLTGYLEYLMNENCSEFTEVVTPKERGSMLCIRLKGSIMPQLFADELGKKGLIVDFRMPNILRICPAPLYNSFSDVYQLIQVMMYTAK